MNNSQNKILNTAALLALGIILLVMFFQWIAAPAYRITNQEMLSKSTDEGRWILPHDLHRLIEAGQMDQFMLVDLRLAAEFNSGTLPGAVNIPFDRLLDKKSRQALKSDQPLLLFSGSESLTSVAGMMLDAKGFEHVYVLANDYAFLKENVLENYTPAAALSKDEKARFDYNRFFGAEKQATDKETKPHPKIIETEVITAGGGC